jgi:subtilisin family serine protease
MSVGGSASLSIDQAVQTLIDKGYTVVTSAGNSTADACSTSPARAANVITVASSVWNDTMSSFSNYGSCVDIFAPGSSVSSAGIASDTEIVTKSGTSMASPHVAGVVATYLQMNPTATPAQVDSFIKARATPNVMTGDLKGTVNLMLYSVLEVPVVKTVPKMYVSELASYFKTPWYNKTWLVYSGLTIVKEDGSPLANAKVTLKESSGDIQANYTCETNSSGQCRTFRSYSRDFAMISIEVTAVELADHVYESSKNTVTQVSITRPYIPWWWPF